MDSNKIEYRGKTTIRLLGNTYNLDTYNETTTKGGKVVVTQLFTIGNNAYTRREIITALAHAIRQGII